MQESWVKSLGWEDQLEKGLTIHFSILAWRIPMYQGAWQVTILGVSKSRTRMSNWTHRLGNWSQPLLLLAGLFPFFETLRLAVICRICPDLWDHSTSHGDTEYSCLDCSVAPGSQHPTRPEILLCLPANHQANHLHVFCTAPPHTNDPKASTHPASRPTPVHKTEIPQVQSSDLTSAHRLLKSERQHVWTCGWLRKSICVITIPGPEFRMMVLEWWILIANTCSKKWYQRNENRGDGPVFGDYSSPSSSYDTLGPMPGEGK